MRINTMPGRVLVAPSDLDRAAPVHAGHGLTVGAMQLASDTGLVYGRDIDPPTARVLAVGSGVHGVSVGDGVVMVRDLGDTTLVPELGLAVQLTDASEVAAVWNASAGTWRAPPGRALVHDDPDITTEIEGAARQRARAAGLHVLSGGESHVLWGRVVSVGDAVARQGPVSTPWLTGTAACYHRAHGYAWTWRGVAWRSLAWGDVLMEVG